ncbi:MAG: M48 family metallopeptidase [Faecalibacterium sp.]|jgi:predicted metal-dependent hydrolase|nr:M48 family metallopeptidase [Faecalibacterium sp.]
MTARCSNHSISVGETVIFYQLERKAVKNINLRIRADGSVAVSASADRSEEQIDRFLTEKADYIQNALRYFSELEQYRPQPKQYVSGESFLLLGRSLRLKVLCGSPESVSSDGVYLYLTVKDKNDFAKKQRLVTRYLDKQCRQNFTEVMDKTYLKFQKYGVEKPTLRIREMQTRWGSCLSRKGIITLNKRLVQAPLNCIEYVVLHEFCHFIHPNHSRQFYDFVAMMMPDWKERKEALEKQGRYSC